MYYSSSTATHAANGSAASYGTPTRKSASSGYRLTAAAAVSSADRYASAAASHSAAAHQHRTATPSGRVSGAAHQSHHHHGHGHSHSHHSHSHSHHGHHQSAAARHPQRYAADKYDRQEATTTVYKAPQLAPAHYESSPYHTSTPSRSTVAAQAAPASSSRRLSASVGASSRSSGAAFRPATQHQLRSENGSSASHGTGVSSSPSSSQQPSLAGFCTQVAATPASSAKSSHQQQHNPQLEDSWVKKVPQYHEYASVRHPPHYYSDAPLLPYLRTSHKQRHLLVLDLDETLVHASAQQPASYDAAFNVDMETQVIRIYVKHRPHMMEFLRAMSRIFEVCVFTASLSKYANQVLDNIDPHKELITHRLYREHCTEVDGSYTKDMSVLGRPTENVVILDNSPVAYMFYPNNAVSCTSWFDDETDTELRTLIPKFEHIAHAPTAMQGLHHRAARRQLL